MFSLTRKMHENKFFSNTYKIWPETRNRKKPDSEEALCREETLALIEKILSPGILLDFPFNGRGMPDDTNNLVSGRQMNGDGTTLYITLQ